jgi:hypothetical protein
MIKNPAFPNEKNPFVTLHELLYSVNDQIAKSNPQALATAIEREGIWGWDRYGRFVNFSIDTPDAKRIMDMIAVEHGYQIYGGQLSEEVEFYREQFDPDDPARTFGWAKAVLPELIINPDEPKSPIKRKSAETREASTLYKLIAALCYGLEFDISESNKTRVNTFQDYLGQLGFELDNNTVRNHLKAAHKLISPSPDN